MNIKQNLVGSNKYNIKCPYTMNATRIVVHNTANDASAENEIAYMIRNNNQVSFHYAVDDKEIVQGIPTNRNAWHSGDGVNGKGNREGIAIEICYSKSGGERFNKAEDNAAKFIASILKEKGWGIDKVTKHQDYAKKNCPHRTLELGWERFLNKIKAYMEEATSSTTTVTTKSIEQLAQEVIAGKYGTGEARKKALGSNYSAVQARVNEIMLGKSTSNKKSTDEIAREVIAGKWGNGQDRKNRLANAGYDYKTIQNKVNQLMK